MSDPIEPWALRSPLGRRSVLRGGALALGGVAAAALIGCGGDDEDGGDGGGGTAGSATAAPTLEAVNKNQNPSQLEHEPGLPYAYGFPEPATEPKDGGTAIIGVTWDVSTFDPSKSAAGGTITVPNVAYNRLIGFVSGIHYDRLKLELKPELAQSWERSPDGMTYTFKIQPGVKWHNVPPLNGRDFVAEDAAFAYKRYQTEGVHTSIWAEADSIEAPDPGTLKVTLKKPLADFLNNLGGRYQTIFPKELVDDGSIDRTVVGTGPMIFRSATAAQSVNFDKNPDYWGGKVHLDHWEFRIIPDANARTAAFRAGQIEYGYAIAGKLSEAQAIVKTNPNVNVYLYGGESGGYGFGMNLQHSKFQDVRVRRAISLANNHDAALQLIYENQGVAAPDQPWTLVWDERPDYKSGGLGEWVKPAGDPAQAKQLLDAAGASGLTINAIYYTYGGYDATRPEVLADQFRQAGMTLNARKADYTEFNSQWVPGKLEEATTSGWGAAGFDADNYFYNQVYSKSPGNRWHMSDPQIDEWSLAQRVELDPEKRRELLQKIYTRVWMDQMLRIVQAGGYSYELQQPWFHGWRSGGPLGSSSYFYDWGEQIVDIWVDK